MTPPQTERWLPHPRFTDYEVSDQGRVRSLKRRIPVVLRPKRAGADYLAVKILHQRRALYPYVHRLVLETFVGFRPEGKQACHNDGMRHNNALSNLRWGTPQENCADRVLHGTVSHNGARFSDDEVRMIRHLVQTGQTRQVDVARQYDVSRASVHHLIHGKLYRHV